MDQTFKPATVISETAELGLAATASLSSFSSDRRSKSLASTLSLSATLLSEVGKVVAQNKAYFKSTFMTKFAKVADMCRKEYETVLTGVEKATSLKAEDSAPGTKDPPKKQWDRFLWALDMENGIFDFDDSLEESSGQISMLHSVVMLVVLQCHAKERKLTPIEQANLLRLKKSMGKLLEALRNADIACVVAFSLSEQLKPANLTQLVAATPAGEQPDFEDDRSSTAASIDIFISSEKNLLVSSQSTTSGSYEELSNVKSNTEAENTDIFEMHRASHNSPGKWLKQTTLRLFGIPFRISRRDTDMVPHFENIPASQEQIKAFLETAKADPTVKQPSNLETMLNIPFATSTAVNALLNRKTDGPGKPYQSHKWSIECLLPKTFQQHPGWQFWTNKGENWDGYILILRGKVKHRQFGPPPPPPPRPQPHLRPLSRTVSWKAAAKDKKPAALIELTQYETETVVNDFLASFSTLYDGVAVEERGAALRALKLGGDDDLDYDSDCSSSSVSSLADD